MSFWPFPKKLTELLTEFGPGDPVIEVGAGSGDFARHLRSVGIDVFCVDRDTRVLPRSGASIAGDACNLPFVSGVLGGVVFADLLRHLRTDDRRRAGREAFRCLRSGGVAMVFEDDPGAVSVAERNYREALDLLALCDPQRGPAIELEEACEGWESFLAEPVLAGRVHNELSVRDPLVPVRWLESRSESPVVAERIMSLRRSVEEHGMSYGDFSFRVHRKP